MKKICSNCRYVLEEKLAMVCSHPDIAAVIHSSIFNKTGCKKFDAARQNPCGTCQYYRPRMSGEKETMYGVCTNSKSEQASKVTNIYYGCPQFYKRGKKAPLWMRLLNKVMK